MPIPSLGVAGVPRHPVNFAVQLWRQGMRPLQTVHVRSRVGPHCHVLGTRGVLLRPGVRHLQVLELPPRNVARVVLLFRRIHFMATNLKKKKEEKKKQRNKQIIGIDKWVSIPRHGIVDGSFDAIA